MAGPRQTGGIGGMFDDRLDVRPPLTNEQLGEIPAKRGVFLLAGEEDHPILLATAASLRARLRGRLDEPDPQETKRSADLRAVTRAVYWKLAGSHFEMDWRYLELARSIWPKTYTKLLSWRPAWFVHVDPRGAPPHFVRTREVFASGGEYLGPFDGARSADRFIEAIQDAFDLCRDLQRLRRSPRAERCAYGQMGRCLCVCDGSVPMDAYREVVAAAAAFAAGRRQDRRNQLQRRMRAAAAELQFERAAAVKARLERLGELDDPVYRHVRPARDFRFLMLQRSGSRTKVSVFLVDRGSVAGARPLVYPLAREQVKRRLGRMARFVAAGDRRRGVPADRWRIGLVARTLFSGERQRGLVLHWHEGMGPEDVSAAVEAAAGPLGLSRARDKAQE